LAGKAQRETYLTADLHNQSNDTNVFENLDSIMDGQSHRAQLSAIIKESGGQAYTNSSTMDDNFLQISERARRDASVTGCGGGAMRQGRVISGSSTL
jgi:hypothetical protein